MQLTALVVIGTRLSCAYASPTIGEIKNILVPLKERLHVQALLFPGFECRD